MSQSLATIVIVNDTGYTNGGAAAVALAEARALHRRGERVVLFCAVGPVAPEIVAENLQVVCLEQQEIATDTNRLRAVFHGLWNRKAAAALSRILDELPEGKVVVHVHSWTKALSSSVVRAAARRVPVIMTLHDYFVACPNGGFYDYVARGHCPEVGLSVGCFARNCDRRGRVQKVYRLFRQIVQRHLGGIPQHIDDFIYISTFSLTHLRPYLPRDARLHMLPNPIVSRKRPPINVAAADAFIFVGRLSPEKGGLLFAEAAQRAGVRAIFVGSGEMEAPIHTANSEAELTGWLDSEQLDATYSHARALVFPSVLYETYGLVVMEAASRGVPAIVSDGGAARDLVIDGETGLLFRDGNVDDLARALKKLTDDPGLASTLGAAAWKRYWSAPLELDRHIDRLLAIYKGALASQA